MKGGHGGKNGAQGGGRWPGRASLEDFLGGKKPRNGGGERARLEIEKGQS